MENLILQEIYHGKGGKIIWSKDQLDFIITNYNKNHSIPSIAKFFNVCPSSIRKALRENNIKVLSLEELQKLKYPKNSNFFENIDTPQKAYWLGFLYADGYINEKENSLTLNLQLNDKNHLEKFQRAIGAINNNIGYPKKHTLGKDYYMAMLSIRDKKIVKDLCNKGCTQNKSLILTFPYKYLTENLYSHFIRGILDGDGTLYWNGNNFEIGFTGTKELLEAIKYILGKDKITLSSEGNIYYFKLNGNIQLKQILEYIYKDSYDEIELTRKRKKYNEFLEMMENK